MEAVVRPAAALAVALAMAACQDDGPCGLRRCDIRQPGCQTRTAEGAACLRGVEPVQVTMSVIDLQTYVQGEVIAPVTPEAKDTWRRTNQGLAMLGLADPRIGYDQALRTTYGDIAGFYADQTITILDRGDFFFDSWSAVTLLVHEYVHALQDRAGRLNTPADGGGFDGDLTRAALIEGEADLVQDFAALELFGRGEGQVPWGRVFDKALAQAELLARRDPLPIESARAYFAYPFGSFFFHGARTARGQLGIDQAWAVAPRSTREIMAGFGGVESVAGTAIEDLGADAEPVLPADLVPIAADRMGSFVLRLFLANLRVGPGRAPLSATARAAAAGDLRGDHLTVFYNPAGNRMVVSWRLRFSRAEAATELASTIQAVLGAVTPIWRVQAIDRDVILLASNLTDPETQLAGPSTWRMPTRSAPAGAAVPAGRRVGCVLRRVAGLGLD
jgi:hypothetical protein